MLPPLGGNGMNLGGMNWTQQSGPPSYAAEEPVERNYRYFNCTISYFDRDLKRTETILI